MNRLFPFALGLSFLFLSVGGASRADTPSSEKRAAPLFTRHVQAVLSRLGCNGGTCHGAVKGQNGFKLSLFSADPALDHERLCRDAGGRRLDTIDPDASLLLRKATGRMPHQGGQRMAVGSSEYHILRRWIAAGAPLDSADRSHVKRLRVHPHVHTAQPGQTYHLRVEASFADGSIEDVTALCSYESLSPSVATVEADGSVTARAVGDTALLVRYRAEPAMARLLVPRSSTETPLDVKPYNFIDRHILAKLRRLNIPAVGICDDATFLRRATLDVTGELPTPAEVRAFLADTTTDKRERKTQELLQRPGHTALWTLKFGDLLKGSDFGVYADGIRQEVDAPRFQQWIRARLEENVPYDQFVERILTATSRDGRDVGTWAEEVLRMEEGYGLGRKDVEMYRRRRTLDLYWQRKSSSGLPAALQVAHAFLGLRLECAQCHRHPYDVWQQDDLLSFANFFMPVRKIGFQGDNEKKFPKAAAVFKRMNDEAKTLTARVKKLRENDFKKLEGSVRQTKPKPSPAALAELDAMRKQLADMERRSRAIAEAARRVMHSEVRLLALGTNYATVTSPIGTQTSKRCRLLGENKEVVVAPDQDPRAVVMAWMRRPDNPYFARAIVNRVWAHYFGRGIINPPDNLSSFNPPSHAELLQELCRGFVENKYDLRWLHRTILTSRTYQQSSLANEANEADRANYAYFHYRRLPAEVLVDALNQATGTTEKMNMEYHFWPANLKTVEIPFEPRNAFLTFMLANFGKPKRNSAVQCDCERDGHVSVLQVLSFANHPRVRAKVCDSKGCAARIVREIADDERRIEEIFLGTLSRLPRDAERQACRTYLRQSPSPLEGLQGMLWSLLNTREFVLQH